MVGWPPDWSLYILNIPVPIMSLYNPIYIYSNCGRFTPQKLPTFLVVSCNSSPHFPTIFWTYYTHWYPRSNSQSMVSPQVMWRSKFPIPNSCWASAGAHLPSGPFFGQNNWQQRTKLRRKLRGPGAIPFGWIWMASSTIFLGVFLEKDRKEMKRCWPFWASWANSWLFRVSWPSNSRLFYLIDRDWKCHYILVGFAPSRQIGWSGPETTSTAKYIGLGIPYKLCLSWSLKKNSVPPDVKHLKLRPTQDRLGRHLWEPFQSNVEFRAWTQPVPPRQRRTKDAEHPCSCKCWGRDL